MGGGGDNALVGAAWVYTLSNGVWNQQRKLVANDATGPAAQGWSVALSADGKIAIVGGGTDNSNVGAAWVYTLSNGVWTEKSKLIGKGAVGAPGEGDSVSVSADGNNVIVGGPSITITPERRGSIMFAQR